MSVDVDQHIEYLNNQDVSFMDKKTYYESYVQELYKYPDTKEASVVWASIGVAIQRSSLLDTQEKTILRNLFQTRSKGDQSIIDLLKRFELEQKWSTNVEHTFLNTFSFSQIIQARELAQDFLRETQGTYLYERIFNIAEDVYLRAAQDHTRKEASRMAFNRYVQLIRNPLFSAHEQEDYISVAERVYLNEGRD